MLKIHFIRKVAKIDDTIPYNKKKFIIKNSQLLLEKYISCNRFKSVTFKEKKIS